MWRHKSALKNNKDLTYTANDLLSMTGKGSQEHFDQFSHITLCSIWVISGKTGSKIKSKDSFEKLRSWVFQNYPYFSFLTMF